MAKLEEKYTLGDELGRGAFSVVYKGINKATGEEVAIKIIDKTSAAGSEADAKRLETEVQILTSVEHPNIVDLRDLLESDDKLYLVMELVEGGELFDKIVDKGQYSERDAATIVRKMVSAIKYLHENGISHRDLKPENLLLGKDDTDVKISDFGLSKIVGDDVLMETACGTPYYVAPEVLSAQGYDKEVDLWSIGVVTYLLLCGFPPFYGDSLPEVFEQIMKADYDFPSPYWDEISDDAKDVVKRLLVVDPSERMSSEECLAHRWIKEGGSASSRSLDIKGKLGKHQSERKVAKKKSLANLAAASSSKDGKSSRSKSDKSSKKEKKEGKKEKKESSRKSSGSKSSKKEKQ